MIATLNGLPVIEGAVRLPHVGVWTADLEVDAASVDGITGRCTLRLGSLMLVGTPLRLGTFAGRTTVRLVGGAGGLSRTVQARSYRAVDLLVPVRDLLADVDESLAASSDLAALRGVVPPHWVRARSTAGAALVALVEAAGLSWRVLADGTVCVAADAWPAGVLVDGTLLEEDPGIGRSAYGVEAPSLLPGVTLGDRRVGTVEHLVGPSVLRTVVWWTE